MRTLTKRSDLRLDYPTNLLMILGVLGTSKSVVKLVRRSKAGLPDGFTLYNPRISARDFNVIGDGHGGYSVVSFWRYDEKLVMMVFPWDHATTWPKPKTVMIFTEEGVPTDSIVLLVRHLESCAVGGLSFESFHLFRNGILPGDFASRSFDADIITGLEEVHEPDVHELLAVAPTSDYSFVGAHYGLHVMADDTSTATYAVYANRQGDQMVIGLPTRLQGDLQGTVRIFAQSGFTDDVICSVLGAINVPTAA
jgi:hypothetical protein